jgi:tripartite-type tricarboxylate transporter receptor subunit TctC
MRCSASIVIPFAILLLGANSALSQVFPDKPVRILSAVAGSTTDILSRALAQDLSEAFGQPVVVENRPIILVPELLKRATADGHTIAIGGTSVWTAPLLNKTTYDPIRDFDAVTLALSYPYMIAVHPAVPAKSVKELIALAKTKPGAINYAQGPTAGGVHLAGALFQSLAGINMQFIPYSGAALGVNATLAGETQVIIYSVVVLMTHTKSGRLRALAVTSAEPSAVAPGIPTVASSGLPGYEFASMLGVLAPAGTPAPRVNRLNQEITRSLNRADMKAKFVSTGADVVTAPPAQFAAKIKSEMTLMGKVIKEAGIKGDAQ